MAIETVAQTFRSASFAAEQGSALREARQREPRGGDVSTIADVARKARVSVPTVSLVISGARGVSPATASAVRAVIDAIDYRASAAARSRIAAPEGARRTVRLDAALKVRDSCARPR
jgi:hypothetical protein